MAIPVPCRRQWALLAVALFGSGLSRGVAGDPAEYTFRTTTSEVRMNFSAMDQNNRGVATLQASDFAVVDKDVIVRNFQSFTRSDWTKLQIAILVDASESVRPRFRQQMADILELVSQTAGVPEENLSIFSFEGSHPIMLCAENCRASQAVERLPARAGGQTPLFDTIVYAADFLAQHGDARAEKVLIVLSDGQDNLSRNSLADTITASLRDDVQMDCIDVNQAGRSQGAVSLYKLASATGGRYFTPPRAATRALNVILEDFRASYIVTYRLPSRTSGFHDVRILPTHNLNLRFRSRSGYYYPNQVR